MCHSRSRCFMQTCFSICILLVAVSTGWAQHDHGNEKSEKAPDSNRSSRQQDGLHLNPPATFAIVGATVHRTPTSKPKVETILVRGSRIVDVGEDLKLPAGTQTVDADGQHVYAGLIDAYVSHDFNTHRHGGNPYWNENVTPELHVVERFETAKLKFEEARKAGFTAGLVAPGKGVVQGQSGLLMFGKPDHEHAILASDVAQHLKLTVSRGQGSGYPNSPMGAVALARQTMYDTQWYDEAWRVVDADPSIERPEENEALAALRPVIKGQQMVMVDTSNELFALRADRFAKEFGLRLTILGSGNEYRRIKEIAELNRPVVLPVNFTKAPDVSSAEKASDVSLETLMHWDHAPENPARLAKNNITFVFTSKGLKDKSDFLKNVRKAVKRGLTKEVALAAMTMETAKLYGVDSIVGSIEKSKIASFTVTDGELFEDKTKVVETWVGGQRFQVEHEHLREVEGNWKLKGKGLTGKFLVLKGGKNLSGKIVSELDKDAAEEKTDKASRSKSKSKTKKKPVKSGKKSKGDDEKDDDEKDEVKVKPISLSGTRLTGAFRSDNFGHKGISLFSMVVGTDDTATGQLTLPDGKSIPLSAKLIKNDEERDGKKEGDEDEADEESDDKEKDDNDKEEAKENEKKNLPASYPVNFPLGAFGRTELPEQPSTVLIKNATVWTLEDDETFEGSVLFGDGVIKAVLRSEDELPESDLVIDGEGMHLTPGIIDCHSHMATDSGVNESGQAITAEVRIGDMVDCDDITIYWQLAGGVTTANVLHGSANPIGGQNQVIKLRWGAGEQEVKFPEAPQGVKFALGENVKQSNWDNPTDRYPKTRMGVEQIMDDALRAAADYKKSREAWKVNRSGLPPRRNLELDAISEILEGSRWIHCHSYRQDEILALIQTLDEHNVTIGSFQHILEGYKVATEMAEHGATASAFADWWAYKYEVKDAIPYAGALMHDAGIVVSFNSDDRELGRHLNQEAVKAVRFGGVSEIEALKFVTLNAAIQLRIEDYVGSLKAGKHADLVLWNGHPLSNLSVVKQTWIDGRKYFDRKDDLESRKEVKSMRLALIQKVLESGEEMESPTADSIDPAKLWPRHDEFCGHSHDHDGHGHDEHDH